MMTSYIRERSPSEQLARDLWEATNDGDVSKVAALLEQGADPNHELYWSEEWKKRGWLLGIPPLHRACNNGNINIARLLVDKGGADVHRGDGGSNRTPIHWVCMSGSLDFVKYLVEEVHCSVDVRDEYGLTPLHRACDYGNNDVVTYLVVKCKCDTNVRDEVGQTPLHEACRLGHKDVVKYLIEERDCDTNVSDEIGRTPLHTACVWGRKDVVNYLAEGCNCDTNVTDKKGQTPLDLALENHRDDGYDDGCLDIALYLINRGCGGDEDKVKVLCAACYCGKLNVVKKVVEQGCDPNVRDEINRTPLHRASMKGHKDVVVYLVESKCDINAKDKHDDTPLDLAKQFGKTEVVDYLNSRPSDLQHTITQPDPGTSTNSTPRQKRSLVRGEGTPPPTKKSKPTKNFTKSNMATMPGGKESPEYRVISRNRTDHIAGFVNDHLKSVADRLRDRDVLTTEQHSKVLREGQDGGDLLVGYVLRSIETNSNPFLPYIKFIDVLRSCGNDALKTYVEQTIEPGRKANYRKLFNVNITGPPSDEVYDIFISYGREQDTNDFVDELERRFIEAGKTVFVDRRSIAPGDIWPIEIVCAIRSCKVFIPVLTKKYVKSLYCNGELYEAEALKKHLFPVVYEIDWDAGPAGVSVRGVVSVYNYAFMYPGADPDFETAFATLLKSIQSRIALISSVCATTETQLMYNTLDSTTKGESRSCQWIISTSAGIFMATFAVVLYWIFFSGTPVCAELPSLANGSISYAPDNIGPEYDIGTVATHSCQNGFNLNGGSQRICETSWNLYGVWNSSSPFCQQDHSTIPAPPESKPSQPNDDGSVVSRKVLKFDSADVPELDILRNFKCGNKKADIVERVATDVTNFGIQLLKDKDGTRIKVIAKSKRHDPVDISNEIFTQWLEGKGKMPVTWATLIGCLKIVKLLTLAEQIERCVYVSRPN